MRFLAPLLILVVSALTPLPAVTLALDEVARIPVHPVSIANAGDQRLFITIQSGTIVIFDRIQVLPTPFLDLRSRVTPGGPGEQGLLGLAFHPQYAANGFFYVNYTDTDGDTVVARYSVSATDPNRADPNSGQTILTVEQPFANHNGGQIQFGPDGYLYIGMGDGGSGGDPQNNAQRGSTLLGKMLRIDVDGGPPYGIPSTNPFVGASSIRNEIWASGLRNPWRFSFDRLTGDLFIADVGQGAWEEVSFQPATSQGGENYGWRIMEGLHCFNPPSGCNTSDLILPVIEYANAGLDCSVTGGYRYRGSSNPGMRGLYLYGDFCSGKIWGATEQAGGSWTSQLLRDVAFNISTFGEDHLGELYVADYGNGILYRLRDSDPFQRKRPVRRQP